MNKPLYIVFLFIFLLLLQVLVLNNIRFLEYINPYLYITFVFLYPLQENRFKFLFFSFLLGLGVDFFSNSGGIHAFSIVFIAYFRLLLIKTIFKKSSQDYKLFNFKQEAFGNVFNYIIILTVTHHFLLFCLTNFSLQNFSQVLLNTITSSIFTLILFFLGYNLFKSKQVK